MTDTVEDKMAEHLSETEEKILFHTLGYEYMPSGHDTRGGYRNSFGICPPKEGVKNKTYDNIQGLVKKGYMYKAEVAPWNEEMYCATDIAKEYVVELWNKKKAAKKPSRSKRRYEAYFDWLECHEGSFKDYLRWLTVTDEDRLADILYEKHYCEYVKEFKEKWNI